MPGSRPRALEKAKTLEADVIILDLEDAVAPDEKILARQLVCEKVAEKGFGFRYVIIRINGMDTEWGNDDLLAACGAAPEAILIPKVNCAKDVLAVEAVMMERPDCKNTKIWAMMETPEGILNVRDIVRSTPRLAGLVMGTNDLVKDLGARHTPDRTPVIGALSMCLLAARSVGMVCVDGVYNAFKDDAGLETECIQGRDMGFDGKTLIHPAQIDVANIVFAPSAAEIDLAETYISAFETAKFNGEGIAVVNGRIVENLHVESARNLLEKANAIANRH